MSPTGLVDTFHIGTEETITDRTLARRDYSHKTQYRE